MQISSKNKLKANHNESVVYNPECFIDANIFKEQTESKSQQKRQLISVQAIDANIFKEQTESKSQRSIQFPLQSLIDANIFKEQTESKSQRIGGKYSELEN